MKNIANSNWFKGINLQLFAEPPAGGEPPATPPATPPASPPADPPGGEPPKADGTLLTQGQGEPPKEGGSPKDGEPPEGQSPVVPEKYELSLPEGYTIDEATMTQFTEVAKELKLTNEQANKLAGMHTEILGKTMQQFEEARTQEVVSWGEEARQELGTNFSKVIQTAGVGMDYLSAKVPGIREVVDKTGFGNTIEGIRMMEMVGKLIGEDPGGRDLGGNAAKSAAEILYPSMKK